MSYIIEEILFLDQIPKYQILHEIAARFKKKKTNTKSVLQTILFVYSLHFFYLFQVHM